MKTTDAKQHSDNMKRKLREIIDDDRFFIENMDYDFSAVPIVVFNYGKPTVIGIRKVIGYIEITGERNGEMFDNADD